MSDLNPQGDLFVRSIKTCLSYLSLGGEIALKSGHKLAMGEEGQPGFLVEHTEPSSDGIQLEPQQMIFQMGSETSWMFLVDHAKSMTNEQQFTMASEIALTEFARRADV